MSIQKTLYLFLIGMFFISCSKKPSLRIPELSTDFLKGNPTKLTSDFFFIGPELDSVNVDIVAECDCCASDLAFLNDSSFVYLSLCLGGDSYVKGNYLVFGNLLILHTDEEVVTSEDPMLNIDSPTTYKINKQERDYHGYTISNLKGKQVITYSKDDYTEYGMATHSSLNRFLEQFRKDKILRRFLEEE